MHGSPTASAPNPAAQTAETPVSRYEFAFLIGLLLIFSEGILPRLVSSGGSSDGSALLRLLWLPVYGITFIGLVWKAKAFAETCLRLPFLMALMMVCALSFMWSIDPGLTQRRSLAIVMTTAAGLFVGTRYSWRTLLRALAITWLIVAVASFVTGAVSPSFGRDFEVHGGAWKGLFYEKNQLGGHMARAALVAAFLIIMDRPYRRVWVGVLVLSILLVLLTTSVTSLLGLLIGLGILGAAMVMKRGMATGLVLTWSAAIMGGAGLGILLLAPDLVVQLLGRDLTLTGRTDIWIVLTDYISQRPALGYGYGAFWDDGSNPGNWVRETLQWDAPTAHNGWFEVTLALGLVGLAFLVLDFLMTLWRAALTSVNLWTGVFALAFCAQFFLFNLSESASLQQNSLIWLIYVAIAAKLTRRPKGLILIKPARASLQPQGLAQT
ncbi:MAG: O-antigen ligase family protein [Henriciella sp.]